MALTGDNLCPSATTAFILGLKHSYSFVNTQFHRKVLLVVAQVLISLVNTAIAFTLVKEDLNLSEGNDYLYIIAPLLAVFTVSLIFCGILFNAFETTQTTLLQCLYADIDIVNQKSKNQFNRCRPRDVEMIVQRMMEIDEVHLQKQDQGQKYLAY